MNRNIITKICVALIFVSLTAVCAEAQTKKKGARAKRTAKTEIPARVSIDLAGDWDTYLGKCRLPGTTDESKLGSNDFGNPVTSQLTRLWRYEDTITYRRTIQLPATVENKKLFLYIERTKPSTLWIDGDSIGSFGHIYAQHIYELPSLSAGEHTIAIRIDNSRSSVPSEIQGSHAWSESTQTNWNGILGDFRIEALPTTHIKDIKVYPDVSKRTAKVIITVIAKSTKKATVTLNASTWNCEKSSKITPIKRYATLKAGENTLEYTINLGTKAQLWSEFHPTMYKLSASIAGKGISDKCETDFGLRNFSTEGSQFVINGYKTFMRGTHDACVFPLTGYAPTDVESWQRLFRIAKQYGLNHFRFHSYTPTEAAFRAADIEGIYLQTELPLWGTIDSTKTKLNRFMCNEAKMVLDRFGNHPSFTMLGLGNELNGDTALMHKWLDNFRKQDSRHLYCYGSNNFLGWNGPQNGEDMFVTCRVGGGPGYSTHVRSSFAYVDAEDGGILNNTRPNTVSDYSGAISRCPRPVISHESGQFQIYPDYKEICKYTGILYPYNLEIFRERLRENDLTDQIDAFHHATGHFAVDCYKADMEYCFRTPGFGGFQLLDLKDYPGQGTALCGILDAFADSKGLITPEEFRNFCAPVVPLALFESYCISSASPFKAQIAISNYEENAYTTPVHWQLSGDNFLADGDIADINVAQGAVTKVGSIETSLSQIDKVKQLILTLTSGKYTNTYKLWVFPTVLPQDPANVYVTDTLDNATKEVLANGGTVLLSPRHSSIMEQSVGGLFTPDYWNYAMFKTISENAKRPVSPGTLGYLMDANHPIFTNFPTEGRSDWQWWCIARNSRPLILDGTPDDFRPIIQAVDNVERNHKLGILMEFAVDNGRLLLTTTDLTAIQKYPEGRQYRSAILQYAASQDFQPALKITVESLQQLLSAEIRHRNIQGVKNISDYDVQPQ